MNKRDIFYYARFYGIPVYFQPETNEMIGRNWFYDLLLHLIIPFELFLVDCNEYKIEIEHRTIKRWEFM